MDKAAIHTDAAPEPVGPYSQAIVSGDFVFCSGQIALDPETVGLVTDSIEEETHRVMDNLQAVLLEAGCAMNNVVKTTIYLRDMDDFARVNEVYASYFTDIPPARGTVQITRLPKDANVEIECIARRMK